MAAGIEAGARLDRRELAAEIRDAVRGARIGGRGEQADDALLAEQVAGGVEMLDADIVEINTPVYARVDVGLCDDERPRLLEERHDLRRHFKELGAAAQHAQFALAHDAERAVEVRPQLVVLELVVAHAEEGEVVGEQPLQKLDRLGELVDRQWRRVVLHVRDDAVDAVEHRAPVGDGKPHFGEDALERLG